MAGTERCNEALQKLEKKYDVVVNIQGDEPLIEPEVIDGIVKALQVNIFPLLFLAMQASNELKLKSHIIPCLIQMRCDFFSVLMFHLAKLKLFVVFCRQPQMQYLARQSHL